MEEMRLIAADAARIEQMKASLSQLDEVSIEKLNKPVSDSGSFNIKPVDSVRKRDREKMRAKLLFDQTTNKPSPTNYLHPDHNSLPHPSSKPPVARSNSSSRKPNKLENLMKMFESKDSEA